MTPPPSPYTPNPAELLLIEALRSGRYKQGKARLHRGDTFCCLGVAEDILNPEPWVANRDFFTDLITYSKGGVGAHLTKATSEKLGWDSQDGYLAAPRETGVTLAHLNDAGVPFAEIAGIIERGEVEHTTPPEVVA